MRSGKTSASNVMKAALAAAEAHAELGAVARLLPAEALIAEAEASYRRTGVFGVPTLAKDLGSAARGLAPAAGSQALRARVEDPRDDSDFFAAMRGIGFIPIGLTTVPEFGFALTSDPAKNPFDPALSPGGSSGGAAAAVAAGIVALAHATDAAGSIRVPAACCGLWGLKPSRGVTPMGPDYGNYLMGIVGEFVLTRSLRDLWQCLTVFDPSASPSASTESRAAKIAVCVPDRCDGAQMQAARDMAAMFAAAGMTVTERPAPDVLGAEAHALAGDILAVSLTEWTASTGLDDTDLSPLSAANAAKGRGMTGMHVFGITRRVQQFAARAIAALLGADAILMPILSGPPPKIGAFSFANTDIAAHLAAMEACAPNAAIANVAGLPALAVPTLTADKQPTALQLMGPPGSDSRLMAMANQILPFLPPIPYPAPIAGMPS